MENKIETSNITVVDDGEVCSALFQRFGEMTDEQRQRVMPKIISFFNFDIIPEELQKFVIEWQTKIKDEKYGFCGFIKNAQINFGYGDRMYRINARTLYTYDSVLESAAPDILTGLMEIGCNYGEYEGYLD